MRRRLFLGGEGGRRDPDSPGVSGPPCPVLASPEAQPETSPNHPPTAPQPSTGSHACDLSPADRFPVEVVQQPMCAVSPPACRVLTSPNGRSDPPSARRTVAIIGTRGYPSYYGGFETAVRKIAPYLADRGWDVTVYGRARRDVDETRSATRASEPGITRGVESKSLSTLTLRSHARSLHALVRKPDVALVMNVANGFWLPLLRRAGSRPSSTSTASSGSAQVGPRWRKAVFRCGRAVHRAVRRPSSSSTREAIGRLLATRTSDATASSSPTAANGSRDLPSNPALTHRGVRARSSRGSCRRTPSARVPRRGADASSRLPRRRASSARRGYGGDARRTASRRWPSRTTRDPPGSAT